MSTPDDGERGRDTGPGAWSHVVDALPLVLPTGMLAGLLYYFGYVRGRAFYAYFGLHLSALDLSPATYVVGSADALFRPFATLAIALGLVFVAHHGIVLALAHGSSRSARAVALGLCVVGALLGVVGVLGLYGPPRVIGEAGATLAVWSPLALASAGLLFEYGIWTASHYAVPPPRIAAVLRTNVELRRGIVGALVLIAAFWGVTNAARARGEANARLYELSLPLQSQAVVYSRHDLHLPGPGVARTELDDADSAYRFRYNGLRPLLYAKDRWYLLPVGWTHANGSTVIVLQDDPERVRVDLAP
jgi:hypothetical protein